MRKALFWLALAGAIVSVGAGRPGEPAATPPAIHSHAILPGVQPDGSVLLPNGWSLRPAGRQVELGDFPVNMAVHPGGRFVAVLHAGYGRHELIVVGLDDWHIVSRTPINETFYGLEFSKDGRRLFCSGASDETVHRFDFQDGVVSNGSEIHLRSVKEEGIPAGLALDASAGHLYAANVWGQRVSSVELSNPPKVSEIMLAEKSAAPQAVVIAGDADADTHAAEKRAEAARVETTSADPFPYACRLDEKRQRLYVSLWAQSSVAVIDLKSNSVIARWPTQEHPCEMALTKSGRYLYVANANRNTVTVIDTEAGRTVETIWAALYPQSPPGSTPNSLALSPDERTLFVANANINAVAVFDVSAPGKSRSLGFIPVGWYPTSVRVTPDGKHLLVANGKGVVTHANPHGPQPDRSYPPGSTVEYIGGLYRGTLSIIDLPSPVEFGAQLSAYTARTYACSPLRTVAGATAGRSPDNPIPVRPGGPSPIQYCIYVVKENRTYDQVFGDMPEGNGDAGLCLFPESITPNHHKLVRQFVLLDNFYANAQVSADGHEWSMGAYATDFVEKTWPLNYGHPQGGKIPYPSEGSFAIATPAGGYLWDRAKEAGISYRSYGEFVANGTLSTDPARTRVKALEGHFDPWYRSFDLNYTDAKRADRFIAELHRFEREGGFPRLQIVRLPNDHTHGSTAGFPKPTAYLGDNDLALGRVVEAVSHSKFWPQTAIFVVEDDAQNGPDHVDAHRTAALVISPYTKRRAVDSTLYATTSMVRTIELVLGLAPMSQFDAAATPMFNSFQGTADLAPYESVPVNVDLTAKNSAGDWGAKKKMNFAREDAVDDLLLNEAVWRSVRGRNHPMPAPIHAAFVFANAKAEDDD